MNLSLPHIENCCVDPLMRVQHFVDLGGVMVAAPG